jgi:hypothetical protein
MSMKRRIAQIAAGIILAVVVSGSVVLGGLVWHVRQSVQEHCRVAQEVHSHPGDDVAALTDFVKSQSHPLAERNKAIWALGHLGDGRALAVLESVYTGELCIHDEILCQYELEKAIKACGGTPIPLRKAKH